MTNETLPRYIGWGDAEPGDLIRVIEIDPDAATVVDRTGVVAGSDDTTIWTPDHGFISAPGNLAGCIILLARTGNRWEAQR